MFRFLPFFALGFGACAETPDHPAVDEALARWQTPMQSARLAEALERRQTYEPDLTRQLEKRGLPEHVIAIAIVESGFRNLDPDPTVGPSAGVWQFIVPTAREYGLRVDAEHDERLDTGRSTAAALDLLADLHGSLGRWDCAFAAYNLGEPAVRRALTEHASNSCLDLVHAGALPPYAADVIAVGALME